ncbi:hypothetical protein [Ensifer sp.]|jgi:Na+/citrate or Na+/malate symporter|uniref:hypothetical protein n=1 Tax=Ensifer sp. TaxID=1872086 RepID=UPI002E1257E4|nr:hypothetical protein [Ensifer sp.]
MKVILGYLPYAIGCVAGLLLSLVVGAVCGLSDDVKMVESVALVVLGGGVAEWYWNELSRR